MSKRDIWLFATLGWDPTWQRRVPRRVKLIWTIALVIIGASLGSLAVIGIMYAPRSLTLAMLGIMVLGVAGLSVIQWLVRREVMGRLDAEQDERAAQEIQSRLLPDSLPAVADLQLAGHYSPYRLVGGDYYDARPIGDDKLLIAMADVSGKGSAAALLTANLQALVQFAHLSDESPEAIVSRMNAHLVRYTEISRYVTMVLAVFDLRTRRLCYVNAGHNPPLGLTRNGDVLRLDATGPALGWFETATYTCAEVLVPPGTSLLFYTDGLSERTNPRQEQFGFDRILDAIRRSADRPAHDLISAIVGDADRFAAGQPADDDTALLVVKS